MGAALVALALMTWGAIANADVAAPPDSLPGAPSPAWSFGVSGALYVLPDDSDFLQPTVRADRGRLHLESRYNYEDRESVSLFAGANGEWGDAVKLTLTPMLGGLAGRTSGIIPALEADLTFGSLEAYGEAEHVFDLEDGSAGYFYMWSELSVWMKESLRAGLVVQRTRVHETGRDIQRGLLVGGTFKKLDGTFYAFNPGSGDRYTVVSIGVSW